MVGSSGRSQQASFQDSSAACYGWALRRRESGADGIVWSSPRENGEVMTLNMMTDRAAIGLFANQADAGVAVSLLCDAGVPERSISVVGGAGPAREAALGNFTPPDFVERELKHEEERQGIFVGGALGLVVGFGIYIVVGIGSFFVLGPLLGMLAGAGVGAILGLVCGGLTFYGVAADNRKQLAIGNYLVFVECTAENETRTRDIMENTPSHADPGKPLVLHSSP